MKCTECGATMRRVTSNQGTFLSCCRYPACDCTCSLDQQTLQPIGTPACHKTREWRLRAHRAFDPLWQGATRIVSKGQAYRWLRRRFGMTQEQAHIGRFSIDECKRLIEYVLTCPPRVGRHGRPKHKRRERRDG